VRKELEQLTAELNDIKSKRDDKIIELFKIDNNIEKFQRGCTIKEYTEDTVYYNCDLYFRSGVQLIGYRKKKNGGFYSSATNITNYKYLEVIENDPEDKKSEKRW